MEYPPPGTALVEELDQKLLVQLRDGRKIIGVLRSFDQFANLVLEHAVERIIVGTQYCDIPLGIYVLRGENLVLMGQVDPAKEVPPGLTAVTEPEIRTAIRAEKEAARLKGSMLARFDFLVSGVLGLGASCKRSGMSRQHMSAGGACMPTDLAFGSFCLWLSSKHDISNLLVRHGAQNDRCVLVYHPLKCSCLVTAR
jgi:U6 snRNA-associated Sm-like protein LSm1